MVVGDTDAPWIPKTLTAFAVRRTARASDDDKGVMAWRFRMLTHDSAESFASISPLPPPPEVLNSSSHASGMRRWIQMYPLFSNARSIFFDSKVRNDLLSVGPARTGP